MEDAKADPTRAMWWRYKQAEADCRQHALDWRALYFAAVDLPADVRAMAEEALRLCATRDEVKEEFRLARDVPGYLHANEAPRARLAEICEALARALLRTDR